MTDDADTITGRFRALRSSAIRGVACTEHVAEDDARYVTVGAGHPEQPPELVRVWSAGDPDDEM